MTDRHIFADDEDPRHRQPSLDAGAREGWHSAAIMSYEYTPLHRGPVKDHRVLCFGEVDVSRHYDSQRRKSAQQAIDDMLVEVLLREQREH